MKVTWNGTGSAWSRRYGNSSAFVEGDGFRLLVDCGHTVPARLTEGGVDLKSVEAVFISHLHGDHVYGLEEWGFKNFLIWNQRPILFIPEILVDAIWTNVLAGTMAQVCNTHCVLNDYFRVVPMAQGQPVSYGSSTLEIHPVDHVPHAPAFGLKVTSNEVSVGFTCDTLANVNSWFYDDVSLIFHDCALYPPFPETVHAHFLELCAYPEEWRRKTYLVHYGDELAEIETDAEFQRQLVKSGMKLTRPWEPLNINKSE